MFMTTSEAIFFGKNRKSIYLQTEKDMKEMSSTEPLLKNECKGDTDQNTEDQYRT